VRWLTVIFATVLCLGCADNAELAREAFDKTLANRDQASIKAIDEYPGGVVCAQYKVSDEWGMRKPGSKFIYVGSALDVEPSKDDWAVFCNADQNAALYGLTGIDAGKLDSSTLETIRSDFEKLRKEFEINKPENVKIGNDPWGTPYIYEEPWYGGVKAEFKFITLGADGKPGGTDENADIGNWHLPYIDYVRNL
jgi:type II secretion system (T2SS) protein G